MRVTSNTFTDTFINQLRVLSARQQRLQNQAASGQRISLPEDDPAAVQRTLNLNAEAQAIKQYSANITTLQDRATASFDAMKAIKKVSDRAGEIATLADGTKSPDELRSYATELSQLIQQAAQVMNTQYRGDYIFGGTQTNQPPFALTTDANGAVTSVTYQGNTSVAENEFGSGVTVAVDVPGANATGTGPRGLITDSRTGADFFNHLISLQNHLIGGDTDAIATTDRPALANDEDNLIFQIGNNGAVQTRLETAATTLSNRSLSLKGLISKETDADLAETLVQYNQAQYAYQAALQSGAGIMQLSLLDYLP